MISWRRPADGTQYPRLLAEPGSPWWQPLVALLLGITGYAFVVPLVAQLIIGIEYVVSGAGQTWVEFYQWSAAGNSWVGLLAGHLGLACLIPVAWGCVAVAFRTRPGWLSSVAGAVRWRWLALATVVSAVLVAAAMVVMSLAQHAPLYVRLQNHFWSFMVVIVVITPFQAAAEEYFFRGFLLQTLGSFARGPWGAIIGSAAVFAAFHGVQNLPLLADRFLFGVLAGLLVWRTGGLEAAVAAHVINNVFAFIHAGMTTSIAEARALQEATWSVVAWHLGTWFLVAVVLWAVARRRQVSDRVGLPLRGAMQ